MTAWLALPWRCTSRFVLRLAVGLAGRQPPRLLGLVAAATGAVAVVQTAQQGLWLVSVVIAVLAVCAVFFPLVDAALARRGEYAADRFAAERGVGEHLVAALECLEGCGGRRCWTAAALSAHPSLRRRADAIARQGLLRDVNLAG